MSSVHLLKNASAPTIGPSEHPNGPCSYQATVTGTGAVAAVVKIQISDDDVNWITLATFTLSGTTVSTEAFPCDARWTHARAELISISGADAVVNALIGR